MSEKLQPARLELINGTSFDGWSFGASIPRSGEVVFNTAMTGYPESLTDPSYKGQVLVATYPLIGNYGVPPVHFKDKLPERFESETIQVEGLVISGQPQAYSHWNAVKSLREWLKDSEIPPIWGVDTRALTQLIRDQGCMPGRITRDGQKAEWYDPASENQVSRVSCNVREQYGNGKKRIMLIDCGVKYNIIRSLLQYDTTVIRVPWDYPIHEELYDGLFITNGPGDPAQCDKTIVNLQQAIQKDIPIFGICLGSQLLALAAGAQTYKLKYGHRSHNQPVQLCGTQQCYITSQNHGYAVEPSTLPKEWKPMFINLNDKSCEGIYHVNKPFFATQFHPEAAGGPTDTSFLFDRFIRDIETFRQNG